MKEMVESPSPSGNNKRNRDPEDEAYLDNFHSHKRYLSEIMASSLNGLTVAESMSDNLIESSPARSDNLNYLRDDMSLQYSPMSEDSDDGRYSESPVNTVMGASENYPTSPSSPHRYQRGNLPGGARQVRGGGSDSEGRFPSSPSDICHSADLRRAALLRSVQMRVQPPVQVSYDFLPSFSPDHELMHSHMESEEDDSIQPPTSSLKQVVSDSEIISGQKPSSASSSCRVLHMDVVVKEDEELCDGRRSNLGSDSRDKL
ncbi:hypothetical protein ACHQM5_025761 [Ranunculus cassubicifolius]